MNRHSRRSLLTPRPLNIAPVNRYYRRSGANQNQIVNTTQTNVNAGRRNTIPLLPNTAQIATRSRRVSTSTPQLQFQNQVQVITRQRRNNIPMPHRPTHQMQTRSRRSVPNNQNFPAPPPNHSRFRGYRPIRATNTSHMSRRSRRNANLTDNPAQMPNTQMQPLLEQPLAENTGFRGNTAATRQNNTSQVNARLRGHLPPSTTVNRPRRTATPHPTTGQPPYGFRGDSQTPGRRNTRRNSLPLPADNAEQLAMTTRYRSHPSPQVHITVPSSLRFHGIPSPQLQIQHLNNSQPMQTRYRGNYSTPQLHDATQ